MISATINTVNIHEAKTNLSKIVEEVKKLGQPMIIAKSGKPQVKIVPLDEPTEQCRFGFMKNKATASIPENFDRLFEDEIAEIFAGKAE